MPMPFDDATQDGYWRYYFMDETGDQTGNMNQAVDGSITPVDFKITAPADSYYFLTRLNGMVMDNGTFDTGGYGNSGAVPLTNGIDIYHYIASIGYLYKVTQYFNIKRNVDYNLLMQETEYFTYGSGDTCLTWKFLIRKNEGTPYRLEPGDSLIWRINDDLTYLSEHYVSAGLIIVPAQYARGK